MLALPVGHHLATRKQITPAMLIDEAFVSVSLEMEVGFWSNVAAITPADKSPRIVARAPDALTVLTLVAAGVGVSVLSASLANLAMPGLVFRELTGVTRTADHALVYRKNESAPVVTAFINSVRSQKRLR
jgi:DNA-binding transcriptional LysR family regulator